MVGWVDVALVILFAAVWPLLEYFWLWPRHVRAVDGGDLQARTRVYTRTLVEEWGLVAAVCVVMLAAGRPLSLLWLGPPAGWALIGFALPAIYLALVIPQARALAAKPESLARMRVRLRPLRALVPHTRGEYWLFIALSATAGFCEELIFRGYLVWVLQHWIGLWGAAGASMVIFGLGHSYQGRSFGLRAFIAGVAMGVLALATRSLLPGMILHALIDMGSGTVTYMAMRTGGEERPGVAVA
jgi:membrane protease YdiL (CAAX protease family)